MDIRDLNYFIVVAEEGHFGRAAVRIHRSQPALTKCIKRIEDDIGAKLFQRVGRGVALTEVGEILLSRAQELRSSLGEVRREIRDFAHGLAGHVRIGTGATTAEYVLPGVCAELLVTAPELTIELNIGMNDVLRKSLRAGKLDLVVGPVTEADAAEFAVVELSGDDVVTAASLSHPLCALESPQAKDLTPFGWVLPALTVATRQWLERAFELQDLPPPRVQIETNSISLMPQLIAKTNLLSFISRRNLGDKKIGGLLKEIPVESTTMKRRLGVVYSRNLYLSPAVKRVIALLRAATF
jgi:DNA-binding transcriptional LysR family regulator